MEGKAVGTIDTLFVRRENLSVPWVRMKTSAIGEHAFAPYADFQTIGVDIALLLSAANLHNALPTDDKNSLDTGLTGRPAMTQNGEQVGSLMGFEINTASGSILSFRVRANAGFFRNVLASVRDETILVPSEQVVSLGPDALIIATTAATALFPASQEATNAASPAVTAAP